jgi:hypothetical protein
MFSEDCSNMKASGLAEWVCIPQRAEKESYKSVLIQERI